MRGSTGSTARGLSTAMTRGRTPAHRRDPTRTQLMIDSSIPPLAIRIVTLMFNDMRESSLMWATLSNGAIEGPLRVNITMGPDRFPRQSGSHLSWAAPAHRALRCPQRIPLELGPWGPRRTHEAVEEVEVVRCLQRARQRATPEAVVSMIFSPGHLG